VTAAMAFSQALQALPHITQAVAAVVFLIISALDAQVVLAALAAVETVEILATEPQERLIQAAVVEAQAVAQLQQQQAALV